MKPVIGITIGYQEANYDILALRDGYGKGVAAAGGNPIFLPPQGDPQETATVIDGLILAGGPDPDPQLFNEDPFPGMGRVDWKRDRFELALTRAMQKGKKPVFGICRGLQMINIAYGGSLYQDIEKERSAAIAHFQKGDFCHLSHCLRITPNSRLFHLVKKEKMQVNSFHHQAVKMLGGDLLVAAIAPDGIIEAVEGENGVFAVQWHPELLLHIPENYLLFKELICTCSKGKMAL